jgi:hypothetical protein
LMKQKRTNFSTRCLLAGLKKAEGGIVATPFSLVIHFVN